MLNTAKLERKLSKNMKIPKHAWVYETPDDNNCTIISSLYWPYHYIYHLPCPVLQDVRYKHRAVRTSLDTNDTRLPVTTLCLSICLSVARLPDSVKLDLSNVHLEGIIFSCLGFIYGKFEILLGYYPLALFFNLMWNEENRNTKINYGEKYMWVLTVWDKCCCFVFLPRKDPD